MGVKFQTGLASHGYLVDLLDIRSLYAITIEIAIYISDLIQCYLYIYYPNFYYLISVLRVLRK